MEEKEKNLLNEEVEDEGADAVVEEPTEDGIEPEAEVETEAAAVEGEVDFLEREEQPQPQPVEEEVAEEPMPEKMLTQSQVNELVGRARQEGRDSAMKELYTRYGVSDDKELSGVFGLGQAYQGLSDEFDAQGKSYKEALVENALLKSKAEMSRWDDIKYILGGQGLDVTVENIESLMPSHPEWRGAVAQQQQVTANADPTMVTREVVEEMNQQQQVEPEKKATVRRLGGEATPVNDSAVPMESEEEKLRRLFGV